MNSFIEMSLGVFLLFVGFALLYGLLWLLLAPLTRDSRTTLKKGLGLLKEAWSELSQSPSARLGLIQRIPGMFWSLLVTLRWIIVWSIGVGLYAAWYNSDVGRYWSPRQFTMVCSLVRRHNDAIELA